MWVVAFWLAVFAWAWVLYRRLKSDHQAEDARIAELLRAIHRVPNYRVIQTFPDFFSKIADAVDATVAAAPENKLGSLEAGLMSVLTLVAGLAAEFARASDDTAYGANIMLVARPQPASADTYDQELIKSLIFYDKQGGNPGSLKAVLYLPGPLVLPTVDTRSKRTIPLISLPVPPEPKSAEGHRLALPGAPWALLTGTQSLVEDTRHMAASCHDFARPIVDEITHYFSDSGKGSEVRSFVSYRIGNETTPVGVLNIDSNHTHVLGREPEYYATFLALISPVLRLLRKPVIEYAQLSTEKGLYLHRAAGTEAPLPVRPVKDHNTPTGRGIGEAVGPPLG